MFKKILIANRGEIACRVISTARRMNIATVAVYSDADSNAKHVAMADEAIAIGPATAAESYLVMDKIIAACKQSGADALHPGYGFLSENAEFAKRLAAENIAFIGPNVLAIESMGDKIRSKQLAKDAGVSTIPGFDGVIRDVAHAEQVAAEVGFPVMIKASAGGGGKGMRVVREAAEVADGFTRATSEAISSFGDGRVLIERFIDEPRHIEIQIIADNHGNVVTLNERECSIQRRHQKVIEEAPSPFIDEATRQAMSEQAIMLAKAVDYCSAGTVELIVDAQRQFYFLEMNTRLQVEHPVTELITDLDLVELMIRVAANEQLPITQADVAINGWAMESRIYAESPERDFLPSTGRLVRYLEPPVGRGVRVDTGVTEGAEISMFYDPMIAKLVTWGNDRDQAIAQMRRALDSYAIRGVDTNQRFLQSILADQDFVNGDITTNFIAQKYPDGFSGIELDDAALKRMMAVMVTIHDRLMHRATSIDGQLRGHSRSIGQQWMIMIGQTAYLHSVTQISEREWRVDNGDDELVVVDEWRFSELLYQGLVDGQETLLQIERDDTNYQVEYAGCRELIRVYRPLVAALTELMPIKQAPDMSNFLLSPMPGLLVSVDVEAGDEVRAGQRLAVVEAMKMENALLAEKSAVVEKVHVAVGETLEPDQIILQFKTADD